MGTEPWFDDLRDHLLEYTVGLATDTEDGKFDGAHGSGSGVCIQIDGRFFIATAAHNLLDARGKVLPLDRINIVGHSSSIHRPAIIRAGVHGGGPRDDEDLAWLEIPRATRTMGCRFLSLERVVPNTGYRTGAAIVLGCPAMLRVAGVHQDGKPTIELKSYIATAVPIPDGEIKGTPERDRKLYLRWERNPVDVNGETFIQPEPPGMSGCGIWGIVDPNTSGWSPSKSFLVAIDYAWERKKVDYPYIIGFQIQEWLRHVADDLPELRKEIDAHRNKHVIG